MVPSATQEWTVGAHSPHNGLFADQQPKTLIPSLFALKEHSWRWSKRYNVSWNSRPTHPDYSSPPLSGIACISDFLKGEMLPPPQPRYKAPLALSTAGKRGKSQALGRCLAHFGLPKKHLLMVSKTFKIFDFIHLRVLLPTTHPFFLRPGTFPFLPTCLGREKKFQIIFILIKIGFDI